jgi:AcrR family transcriptional regulator
MTDASQAKKSEAPIGRPRSADATERVRAAALALAYEGGVQHATVDRIASLSGVAKTTIYRRWTNAASIVMDAYLAEISPLIPYRRKETVQDTFVAAVRQLVRALRGPRGQLLRHLIGAAQSDPQLQEAFWTHWIGPRREQARQVIEGARSAGQIAPHVDADVLVDEIFGAVYYRLLIPYKGLSEAYVDRLIAQVFAGVPAGPPFPRREG